MIALWRSELLRVRSRRVVWVLTIAAAAGAIVGVTIGAVNSQRPTPEQVAFAERQYERAFQRCMEGEFVSPDDVPPEFGSMEEFCTTTVEEFAAQSSDAMELRDLRPVLEGMSSFVILLGAVLGATLVGADWAAGTYGTLLTWEPRRIRVLVARISVVAVAAFVVTAGLQGLFVIAFRVAVALRGSTAGTPPDWLGQVSGAAFRVSLAAVAIGVMAASLATIGRSTVLAVGVLFGYLVLVEGFLAGLVAGLEEWLLVRALSVFVLNDIGMSGFGGISLERARVLVLGYVTVMVAVALVVMRRRDVH